MTMRLAAFTIDVDRDVNQASPGETCALSKDGEGLGRPRFDSSARGLEVIVDVLNDLDVPGTFFFEARTAMEIADRTDLVSLMRGHEVACHSFDHEDLTGEKCGVRMTDAEVELALERSSSVLRNLFGLDRFGFRSPYLVTDQRLQDLLRAKEFRYDSSVVMPLIEGELRPFTSTNGLVQVPVASGQDVNGRKIVAYLWPMHEGKRIPEEYLQLLGQFQDGLFVMATHSWHMVENFQSGRIGPDQERVQREQLVSLLSGALGRGLEFTRIDDYLKEHHCGGC
jgi:peptidoglycan/xylan/chitin deacetylase (PgdA/CDA1 family)